MSQSFTLKDARTQLNCTVSELNVIRALLHEERTDVQGRMFHKINASTIESLKNKLKDAPTYPEPDGDPSY